MIATLRRLLALAARPARPGRALRSSSARSTVLFGVGLMATAGYLISRAAERPAILSLTVAIVGVRFFGLARPIARYLERLASHDLAFRVLGRVRVRVYERIEPLAPAELEGYRRGDLLSRMVADVDALQNLYLRGVGPPLVALVAGAVSVGVAAAFLPGAALVLAVGLLVGGIAVPLVAGALGRRAARTRGRRARRARRPSSSSSLTGARRARRLRPRGRARSRGCATPTARSSRLGRRAALADGARRRRSAARHRARPSPACSRSPSRRTPPATSTGC